MNRPPARPRVHVHLGRALQQALGGPGRWQAVLLLACVMALDSAGSGVIGAVANELRRVLHIGNAQIGLLTAVPSVVGALATIPVGQLVDRLPRMPLLTASILLWSLAMAAGGLARSYLWLLLSRVVLGAVTATAGPMVASLCGDLFPPSQRGRIYARVLSGELLGSGLGLVAGSDIAAVSWRAAFWLIAAFGLGLVFALFKWLPEPRRTRTGETGEHERADPPDRALTSDEDPERWSLWRATKYVLSVRTNVLLIIASAIGFFFFAGLHTFAFELVRDRYRVGSGELTALVPIIGLAALVGVNLGGRWADRLGRAGHATARVIVPGVAYTTSAALFLPGLLTRQVWLALPLFASAAGALAAANPPLDAARLDIMHPRLWGRAESVRTVLRMGAQAVAPVVFGWLSDKLGTGPSGQERTQSGVDRAFLIGLAPLLINGLLLLRARRTYPADTAAAAKAGAATDAHRATRAATRDD